MADYEDFPIIEQPCSQCHKNNWSVAHHIYGGTSGKIVELTCLTTGCPNRMHYSVD